MLDAAPAIGGDVSQDGEGIFVPGFLFVFCELIDSPVGETPGAGIGFQVIQRIGLESMIFHGKGWIVSRFRPGRMENGSRAGLHHFLQLYM